MAAREGSDSGASRSLPPFAAHGDQRLLRPGGRLRQRQGLRDPQAGAVDEFDEAGHARCGEPLAQRLLRGVEALASSSNQPVDVADRQDLGQGPGPARTFDREGGIVAPKGFRVEMLVKLTNGGQAARQRRGAQAVGGPRRQIGLHMGGARLQRVGPLRPEMALVIGKVAAIGFERIGARSALGSERVEKSGEESVSPRGHLSAFGNWIVWVISRGFTLTKFASANRPP